MTQDTHERRQLDERPPTTLEFLYDLLGSPRRIVGLVVLLLCATGCLCLLGQDRIQAMIPVLTAASDQVSFIECLASLFALAAGPTPR